MAAIVIVDAVKSNRQILGKIIETIDAAIAIHHFDRAEAALDWLAQQSPDLVITDHKLPGLDGIAFIEKIRADTRSRELPILMMTMADDLLVPTRARAAGATAFLRRPADLQLVRDRIRSLLPRRDSRGRLQLIIDNSQPSSPVA